MAPTKTTTKSGGSAPSKSQKTLDVDAIAENAQQMSNFLPIADFGAKLAAGKWHVMFMNAKPRQIEKEFDDGDPRLGVDVRKTRVMEDGNLGPVEEETIFLRVSKNPNAKLGSLPNGILSLYREHKGDLTGVRAVIRKRIYDHESFGETCAYDVTEIHDE